MTSLAVWTDYDSEKIAVVLRDGFRMTVANASSQFLTASYPRLIFNTRKFNDSVI